MVILITNGLTWLVLLLWSELFKLVGITFFSTLFFSTDWFMYLTLGLVTALAVILARTQSRLIASIQKLFTLIATGLLPLVSLLTLLFIITLPFAGLNTISRHISAAGLLLTLAFLQLLLMAIVRDPQKATLPWTGPLRCLIKNVSAGGAALCVDRRLGYMDAGRSIRLDYRTLARRTGGGGVTGLVAGVFRQYCLA